MEGCACHAARRSTTRRMDVVSRKPPNRGNLEGICIREYLYQARRRMPSQLSKRFSTVFETSGIKHTALHVKAQLYREQLSCEKSLTQLDWKAIPCCTTTSCRNDVCLHVHGMRCDVSRLGFSQSPLQVGLAQIQPKEKSGWTWSRG